jgi:hypothetical protein
MFKGVKITEEKEAHDSEMERDRIVRWKCLGSALEVP